MAVSAISSINTAQPQHKISQPQCLQPISQSLLNCQREMMKNVITNFLSLQMSLLVRTGNVCRLSYVPTVLRRTGTAAQSVNAVSRYLLRRVDLLLSVFVSPSSCQSLQCAKNFCVTSLALMVLWRMETAAQLAAVVSISSHSLEMM